MPLRAKLDGRSILAFSLPPDVSWEDLKIAAKAGRLTMPCCGVSAVPKIYHDHGTHFFAHKARTPTCDWKGENKEHEWLKTVAAQAALDVGASAETEVTGPTWRADIFAETAKGKYAIEIQLSAQTTHVTKERSQGYVEAGVEVLWFMKHKPKNMKIDAWLRVLILPKEEGAWAEFVERYTKLFVLGDLVWDDGRIEYAPVTFIGLDAICPHCGEIWHYTPWARIRNSEVSTNFRDEVVPYWRVQLSGPGEEDRPSDQVTGNRCPVCEQEKHHPHLTEDEAAAYPWQFSDGAHTKVMPPNWRARRAPGKPRPPVGDIDGWNAFLQRRGLVLDRARIQPTVDRLRQKWIAEYTERQRREEEALLERKRFEEERRLELVQLTKDVERGVGPVKVTLERSDTQFHTIRSITFDFPYHKGLVAAIKRAFRNAWFDPATKKWKVAVSYGADRGMLIVAKELLDHLRADNWPRADGRFRERVKDSAPA